MRACGVKSWEANSVVHVVGCRCANPRCTLLTSIMVHLPSTVADVGPSSVRGEGSSKVKDAGRTPSPVHLWVLGLSEMPSWYTMATAVLEMLGLLKRAPADEGPPNTTGAL